ncbi:hypothetical protein ACFL35_21930, partial [Candidatus Riflebacteria bacterium]
FTYLDVEQPEKNPFLSITHFPIYYKKYLIGWVNIGFDIKDFHVSEETFLNLKSLAHMLSTYLAHSHFYWETWRKCNWCNNSAW